MVVGNEKPVDAGAAAGASSSSARPAHVARRVALTPASNADDDGNRSFRAHHMKETAQSGESAPNHAPRKPQPQTQSPAPGKPQQQPQAPAPGKPQPQPSSRTASAPKQPSAPKQQPSARPQSPNAQPRTGAPSRKADGEPQHTDLSQARRVVPTEAAAGAQKAGAQQGAPHDGNANNANAQPGNAPVQPNAQGTPNASNASNAGNESAPNSAAGNAGNAGSGNTAGNDHSGSGENAAGNAGNGSAANNAGGNAGNESTGGNADGGMAAAENLADSLFNGQQTAFDAEKAAAREKIANGHDGSRLNGMMDKASNAVNDGMTGLANGINNRMQANGNGNLFDPNGGMMNKLGNAVWRHGGADLTAKGLNAVNKGVQGAIRGVQQAGQKISKYAHAFRRFITSPATWLSFLGFLVVCSIIAAILTYGDGGIQCPNQGASNAGSGDEIASWAEKIAADDSHGYSQPNRNGDPDYDCSSLVYHAVTEGAGIKLGIDYAFATGDSIDDAAGEGGVLQAAGFSKHPWDGKDTSVLQRGDIVWSAVHTEIYSGDGKFTGAHYDENGDIAGSQKGDQKGDEISTTGSTPSGMSYFLRSPGKVTSDSGTTSSSGSSGGFKSDNAKQIFEYLTNEMGFSGAGAAGALAVARRESGFDPKAQNSGGGVAGIFQWSGYSNEANKNRITKEGSIKSGDESTLTMENELKLLKFELNGSYHAAKVTVGNASDPAQAAKDWSEMFEGVPLSDGQSHVSQIEQWANEACDAYDCKSISAQPDKLNEGGNGSNDTNPSTTKNASTQVQCMLAKNNKNTGSTGSFKMGTGDYSWMCDDERLNICKPGDHGPVPALYGYQCVWYAWTRLYMIHGINETYTGNGGQIGETATEHGWTNPETPAPGDGLSYYGLFDSSGRPTGHVMVVEKVEDDPSGWKITLSEGNYYCASSGCWTGYNGGRTITKKQMEDAGGVQGQNYWFFHNPKWDTKTS